MKCSTINVGCCFTSYWFITTHWLSRFWGGCLKTLLMYLATILTKNRAPIPNHLLKICKMPLVIYCSGFEQMKNFYNAELFEVLLVWTCLNTPSELLYESFFHFYPHPKKATSYLNSFFYSIADSLFWSTLGMSGDAWMRLIKLVASMDVCPTSYRRSVWDLN